MSRLSDLVRLYALMGRLKEQLGGTQILSNLKNISDLPRRGVYFFFEPGEVRRESGDGLRIVRVGTHALTAGSRSTISQRLGQHRGSASGGGHHRTSIFRLLAGGALLARGGLPECKSWGVKGDHGKAAIALNMDRNAVVISEAPIEQSVTSYLGTMPFLWLDVDDEPGPESRRGFIERNAIALLSNLDRAHLDPQSAKWLGSFSDRPLVRGSGLWNQRHVDETHDPEFLNVLEATIARTERIK